MSGQKVLSAIATCVVGLLVGWFAFASVGMAQEAAPYVDVTLPGLLEAEHYDSGVDGVTYSDTDEHRGRGGFRSDDPVDAFVVPYVDASGGTLLGRTRDGEFTQYTVNVDTRQEFEVRLRVASGAADPGVINVRVDDIEVGAVDGNTDAWYDWQIRSAGMITLDPGVHVVRLTWEEGAEINLDWLELDTRRVRIEAEAYNSGVDGIDYSDTDPHLGRGNFRSDDPVDAFVIPFVGASSDTLLGRTRDGEFTQYSVYLDVGGNYEIDLRVASGAPSPGVIHVAVDGIPVGTVDGDTGAWFNWQERSAGTITLSPGTSVVRLSWGDGAEVNLDWLQLTARPPTHGGVCPSGTLEAEDATLSGRFEIRDTPQASGGKIVHVPRGSGGYWNGISDNFVEFCTSVDNPGSYQIGVRLTTPSTTKRSFYVSVNNGPLVDFVAKRVTWTYQEDAVNSAAALDPLNIGDESEPIIDPMRWDLEAGDHTIRFYLRRDGVELDTINLNQGPTSPPNCGDCDALLNFYEVASLYSPPGNPCDWAAVTCSNETPRTVTGLTLSASELRALPPEIGALTNLTHLTLSKNFNLATLPPEIGSLTNLTHLNLTRNDSLASLPPEISNLANLTHLTYRYSSQLRALPSEIGDLTSLTHLDVSNNYYLFALPAEIGNLTALTHLTLNNNRLRALPPEIGGLTNLTHLNVGTNELPELPPGLSNLRELNIRNNNLRALRPEITDLTNLTHLDVSVNSLTTVPSSIGNLTNLTHLDISTNSLTAVPSNIGNLTNLTDLDMSFNNLPELPAAIGSLTRLARLDLRYNALRGDITVLEFAVPAQSRILLVDFSGGNDCLTTTNPELATYLTLLDSQWDLCENP